MAEAAVTTAFTCPGCSAVLDGSSQWAVQCPACRWMGDVYSFSPRVLEVDVATAALPEDATCLHHPRKKAVAVCAGTGDYICSLCSIELNGQTFSAQYLDNAGKEVAGKAFDKTLARPDSRIVLYMILCFVPYLNVIFLAFAFVWIPHAVFLFSKMRRMRRENEIYHRVVGTGRMVTLAILLTLFALGWTIGVTCIVFFLWTKRH